MVRNCLAPAVVVAVLATAIVAAVAGPDLSLVPTPPSIAPAGAQAVPQYEDAELQALMDSATSYLDEYLGRLTSIVAEESYQQVYVWSRVGGGRRVRRLRSDFLLVQLPGHGLVPFRDVFEVDGKPVRDRDDRLRKLFLDMPEDALDTARQISDEGARYNLGTNFRNVNQPMLALKFLAPEHLPALELKLKGEESIEGHQTRRVDFRETGSPTVVRDLEMNDVPASGACWIEVGTGRIVKTALEISRRNYSTQTTVVYRPIDEDTLWAPAEMREFYAMPGERITGNATYSNFRRFQVKTETIIR